MGEVFEVKDNYSTPKWVLKLFEGWYDPCPLNTDELRKFDGLGEWKDKTFVNPPYSNPIKWVENAIRESKKGKTIAMLLRVDTSTKWFAMIIEARGYILWFNKRLKFGDTNKPANFPSMLVIFYGGGI